MPGFGVIGFVRAADPARHRLLKQSLECALRIGAHHQVRAQQRGVGVVRTQRGDQLHMVELVPVRIAAPLHLTAHGCEAGLRGLAMPLHIAADHNIDTRLRMRESMAQYPRLLMPSLAEDVVVGRTERGLPVADQIHRAHAATGLCAIARRQRQCR